MKKSDKYLFVNTRSEKSKSDLLVQEVIREQLMENSNENYKEMKRIMFGTGSLHRPFN